MLQLSQPNLTNFICSISEMFDLAHNKSKMFKEFVCFTCPYKNVNASISLAQPVCKC
jgi:hypothetical protein